MEKRSLENILLILNDSLKEKDFDVDKEKILDLCHLLEKFKEKLPTIVDLDTVKKKINYLEIRYDIFNELSYYFDPLYVEIKNKINSEKVKEIRNKNKRKRNEK